jgi:hypothetical protein
VPTIKYNEDGFTDLVLKVINAEDHPEGKSGFFEVYEDCYYRGSFEYMVPARTLTDLASIPFFLRWLYSRTGRSRKPAVFHDHMYGRKWRTRKKCDDSLKEMLLHRGSWRVTASSMKIGVRLGGWTRGRW